MKPKYEWLKIRNVFDDDYIYDDDGSYLSWAEGIPDGWYKAFGEQMIDELHYILDKWCFTDRYRIMQIKEKFGMIRWYDNGVPQYMCEEYDEWLDKYERLSEETCIKCGDKATHMTTGWIVPLCDKCGK